MGHALRTFVPRAPRYVLRADDNKMMRFAPNKELGRTYTTQFYNVSETGLGFIVDRSSAPRIGDLIKLEFSVPGGGQIAWFAKVVRIEEFHSAPWWSDKRDTETAHEVLVGVQFEQLPDGHRKAIRVHLQAKFLEAQRKNRSRRWRQLGMFLAEHSWQITIYMISILLTFAVLYMLSRPSANYDPEHGAPWGQRFKF